MLGLKLPDTTETQAEKYLFFGKPSETAAKQPTSDPGKYSTSY